MNQIIKPKTVNFKELVKNSNTTLTLNLQSKLVTLLNEEFSIEEQKWYIANLFMYMNYNPTTDYPINLENVFKMIGFANKGNAMKTIKSNFTVDEDYKTLLFPMEKQKPTGETRGGHNHETIMLNIDTFKNLCMLAKTQQGKEIRRYYVKLENINNRIIKEEMEDKNTQYQLQLEKKEQEIIQIKKKNKLMDKRWYNTEPCDTVYVFNNNNEKDDHEGVLINIGKTRNIAKREINYLGANQNGNIV